MSKCFYPNCPHNACKKACPEHAELYAKWTNNNYNRQRRCGLGPLTLDEYIEHSKKWWTKIRATANRMRSEMPRLHARDSHDGAESTECHCPRCGKNHYTFLFWTGRGTPRVYCQKCKDTLDGYERPEVDVAYKHEPRIAPMAY